MRKIGFIFWMILITVELHAQQKSDIYFNYDELVGFEIIDSSHLEVYYKLKGKTQKQKTDFTQTENGIKLGKLSYNANPNVKKLSAEPLESIDGNLYLKKYRMFFYSGKNRKKMEKKDCYIVNNQIYFTKTGKIKGDVKKAIKNLRKESLKTMEINSKTTYDKYGIHCIGATEILGIPIK